MRFYLFGLIALTLASCAKPLSKFDIVADEFTAPATISFENKSSNSKEYNWNFGDGKSSKEQSPEHHFLKSGRYTISLSSKKGTNESTYQKEIIISAPSTCQVFVSTSLGNMVLELSDKTPKHRDNFLSLVESGYYNGVLFHRVIDGFIIQAGEQNPNNKRVSQTKTIVAEINDHMRHYAGTLSASRMPDNINPEKESSATQFYVVDKNTVSESKLESLEKKNSILYTEAQKEEYLKMGGAPQLDENYTVFGKLLSGFDTLKKISSVKTAAGDRPVDPVTIIQMTLIN